MFPHFDIVACDSAATVRNNTASATNKRSGRDAYILDNRLVAWMEKSHLRHLEHQILASWFFKETFEPGLCTGIPDEIIQDKFL